jgi:pescadillo protein
VGAAKNYITRTQAVRKLQISLPDFRRLCIFKGIYPREPRNKKKVKKGSTPSTTFYYTKDIQYLFHEPLLAKFRDHKALAKKIGRALGRNEVGDAVKLDKNAPRMTLDHLVKERYPSFVDALRDLDDALSMLFLFANLPSTSYVPPKTIALCQRLCLEFQHYLIVSRSLRRSFLSIKGIYYQATIQGQDIMWLVPYKFVQRMAGDIDFRIMATFIEFYTTLLGFVNYRLYTTVGLVYPPTFDAASDERGGELGAFTLKGRAIAEPSNEVTTTNGTTNATNGHSDQQLASAAAAQAEADKVALIIEEPAEEAEQEVQADDLALDTFEPATTQDADVLAQPKASDTTSGNLFADFTFFLSRETPKTSLEFILKAFGCNKVGWHSVLGDGAFTMDEQDPRITHQIVDRPIMATMEVGVPDDENDDDAPKPQPPLRVPGRIYVQPQWVWDSINQGKLLRPDLYGPGAALPPHLSPWVKPKTGGYDPTIPLEEQEKDGEAELFEEEEAEAQAQAIEGGDDVEMSGSGDESSEDDDEEFDEVEAGEGMDVDGSESEAEDNVVTAAKSEWNGGSDHEHSSAGSEVEQDDQYQRELEAEAAGLPIPVDAAAKTSSAKRRKAQKEKAEQEELDRQRMMMPNKKRKLFNKMQHGNKKREAEAEKLRMKRRKLEKQAKGGV